VTELLLLALLGGLLALESTSVGQLMLSRPLVAGTLTGWVMGSAAAGFAVGTILEVYLLVSLPVGASRYPEGGLATVIAAAVALDIEGEGALNWNAGPERVGDGGRIGVASAPSAASGSRVSKVSSASSWMSSASSVFG